MASVSLWLLFRWVSADTLHVNKTVENFIIILYYIFTIILLLETILIQTTIDTTIAELVYPRIFEYRYRENDSTRGWLLQLEND